MTDKTTELIAEARSTSAGLDSRSDWELGELLNGLADALEAEHQRAEGYRIMQRETAKTARTIVAERDALRAALQEATEYIESDAGISLAPMMPGRIILDILSRAIDTKEAAPEFDDADLADIEQDYRDHIYDTGEEKP